MATHDIGEADSLSKQGPRPQSGTTLSLPPLAAAGDVLVLVMFAAIGRASHGEHDGALGVLGTAAPFLAGWFVAAFALHAYSPRSFASVRISVRRTAITWLLGGLLGLGIRSALEGRVVPVSFAAIALAFNLATLSGWRAALTIITQHGSGKVE